MRFLLFVWSAATIITFLHEIFTIGFRNKRDLVFNLFVSLATFPYAIFCIVGRIIMEVTKSEKISCKIENINNKINKFYDYVEKRIRGN